MELNKYERLFLNTPFRTSSVEYFIRNKRLHKLNISGGDLRDKKILEVGCGSGIWTESILRHYSVKMVHAFDIDKTMVNIVHKRLSNYIPRQLLLFVANATNMNEPNESFDLVFEIAILHHIENWQKALKEIYRVLKKGGIFYFEEVNKKGLNSWIIRTFFEHPKENRFTTDDFINELESEGIIVQDNYYEIQHGKYFIGKGTKI